MEISRTAFVTGGGGGIGSAICRALAGAAHRVAVADLSLEAAQRVATEIGGVGIGLDVTDPASVDAALEQSAGKLGAVEICVNCAGWDELKPFLDTDEEFQRRVLEINLAGPIRVTRAALPAMIERRWGRLINIASDAGRVGSSLEAIYSGAKGGLIAFTKTMAREMARFGITANAVCPGPTKTPLLEKIVETGDNAQKVIDSMTRGIPMKRLGAPEDVAGAVLYLASEGASYVTGQTVSVSGGLTMI
jgi:2-hydroxycyclohexanecarboxyl-CoA dehydrogenase